MRYIFFFSYARFNRDKYLLKFYQHLSDRISELVPMDPAEMQAGFIDENLERGTDWQPAIIDALQNSRVLLCAYSPHYFDSEYCSREWHIFQMRRNKYPQASDGKIILPSTIKPVIWVSPFGPLTEQNVHPDVLDVQYTRGDAKAVQNANGVKQMLRMGSRYRNPYIDFINALADEILKAAKLVPALPELPPPLPRLSDVPPLFPIRLRPAPPPDAPPPGGPPHSPPSAPMPAGPAPATPPLHFVCVSVFPQWRPFGPAGETIDYLVQSIAAEDLNMMCYVHDAVTTYDIERDIESAAMRNQVLVLLVDEAAIDLLPGGLSEQPHCLVVVVGPARPAAPPSAAMPWINVTSASEIRTVVAERVPRLRSKVRSNSEVYLTSLTMNKPIISASSTQRPF